MPNRPFIRLCVFLIEFGVIGEVCYAGSADWLRTGLTMRFISEGAARSRAESGDWPRTDARSTWMRKLIDSDLCTPEALNCSVALPGEYGPALDDWGREISYVPPAPGASGLPLIRSVGENGIDEAGAGDDLTHGRGINPGSYWKRHYAKGWWRVAIFASAIAMLVACASVMSGRHQRMLNEIGILLCGVGLGVAMPCFSLMSNSTLVVSPGPVEWAALGGWLLAAGVVLRRVWLLLPINSK